MNYFTKKRVVIWVVVILVVLNVSALITILYERNINCGPVSIKETEENQRFREINGFMREDLNLSPSQTNKVYRLRRENYVNSNKILQELDQKRKDMLAELQKEQPDQQKLDEIATDIGNLHKNLKLETIQYFLKLKDIIGPEQQIKLNRLFRDMEYYHDQRNNGPDRGRARNRGNGFGPGQNRNMPMRRLNDSVVNNK